MGERTLESQTPIRNEKNKHQQLVCYVPDHMADHPCYFSTLTFFASLNSSGQIFYSLFADTEFILWCCFFISFYSFVCIRV